jgi:aspartyl aminopeptidase
MSADFADFISESCTPYNFIVYARPLLLSQDYVELFEDSLPSELPPKFFVVRDGKMLLAFNVDGMNSALVVAAHSDSPGLKVKPVHDQRPRHGPSVIRYASYADGLGHSYHGRDLKVAGAVLLRDGEIRVVDGDRPICIIPFPSCTSDGLSATFDRENGMNPIFTLAPGRSLMGYVADLLGVDASLIVGQELSLVDSRRCTIFGDVVVSPRLDDLASAYCVLRGFLDGPARGCANVCAIFDSEEIGSRTRTGACSDLLAVLLRRLCAERGVCYDALKARSLFVSADGSHGMHPNHPNLWDVNHPIALASGVNLNESYNGAWAYDALGTGIVIETAKRSGVKFSLQCLRNGRRQGSTIGNKVAATLGIRTIEIGHPQLAMHSHREIMAWSDIENLMKFCTYLYGNFEDIRNSCAQLSQQPM